MKICIVDYLGTHCGMHYYNDAFGRTLSSIPGLEVTVLSNYTPDGIGNSFFCNQYRGSKFQKFARLLLNYWRLFCFVLGHKDVCFIYLTYGNRIDLPFLWIVSFARKFIIDIHEAIAQDVDNSLRLKKCFKRIYSKRISSVIVHSQRTNEFLNEYGYLGERLFVPHFKYCFKKNYEVQKLGSEIVNAVVEGKVNVLFFGNINYNKGVDVLIEAVNKLDPAIRKRINVIIAGKDFDGAVYKVSPEEKDLFHIVLRHIEDDELIYLYKKIDYVALPYRKTSQSGILEMAFYFKKPILATKIPYFEQVLTRFPSFGVLSGNDAFSYSQSLAAMIDAHSSASFFREEEYERYVHRKEVDAFKKQFSDWINK